MQFIDVNEQQQLFFNETQNPNPAPGQCLVKVRAVGINRADLLQRAGKYPPPPGESPIIGLEVCGDVVGVGEGVNTTLLNQRVFGLVAGGGYAQYVTINADHILQLPENLSYNDGAAIAEVFLTAIQSLFKIAQLRENEHVLIHAGASGVGSAAIQLAKVSGATVTVTVSNEDKVEACKALGADNVINYKDTDFVTWQKENLPNGFNVILDVVGGSYLQRNINVAARDARIVMLAMLGGRFCDQVDVAKMLMKRINIHASTLRNRTDEYKADLVKTLQDRFMPYFENEQMTAVIQQVFPWQEAEHAHILMSENKNIGKYILTVS